MAALRGLCLSPAQRARPASPQKSGFTLETALVLTRTILKRGQDLGQLLGQALVGRKLPFLLWSGILGELQAWGLPQSPLTFVSVLPPTGGENIKSINQQSGAHVELQRNPPPSTDPNLRIFTIRGLPPQIEVARHLIDEKVGVRTRVLPPESWGFLLYVRGTCFPPEPHTSWASGSSGAVRAAAPSPIAEGRGLGAGTVARPRHAGLPRPPPLLPEPRPHRLEEQPGGSLPQLCPRTPTGLALAASPAGSVH